MTTWNCWTCWSSHSRNALQFASLKMFDHDLHSKSLKWAFMSCRVWSALKSKIYCHRFAICEQKNFRHDVCRSNEKGSYLLFLAFHNRLKHDKEFANTLLRVDLNLDHSSNISIRYTATEQINYDSTVDFCSNGFFAASLRLLSTRQSLLLVGVFQKMNFVLFAIDEYDK